MPQCDRYAKFEQMLTPQASIEFIIFLNGIDEEFFNISENVVHVEDVLGAGVVEEHLPL